MKVYLFLLPLMMFGCAESKQPEAAAEIMKGGSLQPVEVLSTFRLDSVQFSAGFKCYSLTIDLLVNGEICSETIFMKNHPLRETPYLVSLKSISPPTRKVLTVKHKVAEYTLEQKDGDRMYLKQSITSGR